MWIHIYIFDEKKSWRGWVLGGRGRGCTMGLFSQRPNRLVKKYCWKGEQFQFRTIEQCISGKIFKGDFNFYLLWLSPDETLFIKQSTRDIEITSPSRRLHIVSHKYYYSLTTTECHCGQYYKNCLVWRILTFINFNTWKERATCFYSICQQGLFSDSYTLYNHENWFQELFTFFFVQQKILISLEIWIFFVWFT